MADKPKIEKTDEEWRSRLTPDQFRVLRQHGTERAFSNPLNDEKRDGVYSCMACGMPLFTSDTKYDSGSGWPSFFQPISPGAVTEKEDNSMFMRRVEVCCATCGSHLGHVFPDGPNPTGQRYCMNGTSLDFEAKS
ncbi:MAG TPA: peptide-methionine (R)-S-oxide reductase MsrB [Devosiaceae bacterium]|nr:peptide-methionine (R)-S-oxide reductase MsrB [Devosiaceae bacterium]